MSHNLNSLKGGFIEDYRITIWVAKGDARSLDYGPYHETSRRCWGCLIRSSPCRKVSKNQRAPFWEPIQHGVKTIGVYV